MKNLVVFCMVISLFLFSGCQSGNGNFSSESSETSNLAVITNSESSETSNLAAAISNIGKTLDDLQLQHPSYEYLHLDGYDFSAECLGFPGETFAYIFTGTQAGPSLEELASQYGKRLKCAGIYTTVDEFFSITNEGPVSIEDFLLSIGIDIKDSDRVYFWSGWILFKYKNYSMALNTKDIGNWGTYDIPTVKIEKGFPLMIMDEELWSSNDELYNEFMDTNSQVRLSGKNS